MSVPVCTANDILELNQKKEYTLTATGILDCLLTNPKLNAQSVKLWQLLFNKSKFQPNLEVKICYKELANRLHRSQRSISRYVRTLVQEGFLLVKENFGKDGSQYSNTLYVRIPNTVANQIKTTKDRVLNKNYLSTNSERLKSTSESTSQDSNFTFNTNCSSVPPLEEESLHLVKTSRDVSAEIDTSTSLTLAVCDKNVKGEHDKNVVQKISIKKDIILNNNSVVVDLPIYQKNNVLIVVENSSKKESAFFDTKHETNVLSETQVKQKDAPVSDLNSSFLTVLEKPSAEEATISYHDTKHEANVLRGTRVEQTNDLILDAKNGFLTTIEKFSTEEPISPYSMRHEADVLRGTPAKQTTNLAIDPKSGFSTTVENSSTEKPGVWDSNHETNVLGAGSEEILSKNIAEINIQIDSLYKKMLLVSQEEKITLLTEIQKLHAIMSTQEITLNRKKQATERLTSSTNQNKRETMLIDSSINFSDIKTERELSKSDLTRLKKAVNEEITTPGDQQRIFNEIVFAIRFGALRVSKNGQLLSTSHAISIGLKLLREKRWETPAQLQTKRTIVDKQA